MDKKRSLRVLSRNAQETKAIGRTLAKFLKAGDIVAVEGPLGAGKTTLVQGLAKGLGVRSEKSISSPTFVLMHEYHGREKIYHLDWYRLEKVQDADAAMAEECFNARAITLVEWSERGGSLIPKNAIRVRIRHAGADHRRVEMSFP
jgi:tRNA threonylcarbamoyladenosine biosynthesis protein TsaE